MSKLGKFSLQVTMVLWTLFRMRLTKKHFFQNRKFAQLGLREVLTLHRLQSSLSAKAAVGASMSVCESWGNLHLVLFESDEQGGDQYASQKMTYHAARQIPGSSEVVDLKDLLVQINWFVSEHRQL